MSIYCSINFSIPVDNDKDEIINILKSKETIEKDSIGGDLELYSVGEGWMWRYSDAISVSEDEKFVVFKGAVKNYQYNIVYEVPKLFPNKEIEVMCEDDGGGGYNYDKYVFKGEERLFQESGGYDYDFIQDEDWEVGVEFTELVVESRNGVKLDKQGNPILESGKSYKGKEEEEITIDQIPF